MVSAHHVLVNDRSQCVALHCTFLFFYGYNLLTNKIKELTLDLRIITYKYNYIRVFI